MTYKLLVAFLTPTNKLLQIYLIKTDIKPEVTWHIYHINISGKVYENWLVHTNFM